MKQITTDWLSALGMVFSHFQYMIFCNFCLPNHCILHFNAITSNCFQSNRDPEERQKCEACVWLTLRSLLVKMSEAWPELPLTNHVQEACRPARPPLHPTMCAFRISRFSLWSANCGCKLDHKWWGCTEGWHKWYLPSTVIYWIVWLILRADIGGTGAAVALVYPSNISLLSVFKLH